MSQESLVVESSDFDLVSLDQREWMVAIAAFHVMLERLLTMSKACAIMFS